jgi:hypothetical protein
VSSPPVHQPPSAVVVAFTEVVWAAAFTEAGVAKSTLSSVRCVFWRTL